MSASFVISTQDMDRSGEVVETSGIRTESHRLNPVVLWDHGRGPIGRLPIGQCQDPSGNYTIVTRSAEGIAIARVYFSKSLPFASDVFKLVQEGIIRGASIGFRSLDADPMPGHSPHDEDAPLHYREVELCELSLTAVPDNPRSLAIQVSKAFTGRRLSGEMATVIKGWETEKAVDASGHEHAADGKFGSGGSAGPKKPKGGVGHTAQAADATERANKHDGESDHAKKAGMHAANAKEAIGYGDHRQAAYQHQRAAEEHRAAHQQSKTDLVHGRAALAHEAAAAVHRKFAGEKSMASKTLGRSFVADIKSLNESGIAVLSKALASITGKSADEYLKMDKDGKLDDETVAGEKSGMNGTSGSDGGFLDSVVEKGDDAAVTPAPDATATDAAPAEDVPAYKQPLEGPPSQAAAADLHTQLASVGEAIQGWAARQENEEFKSLAQELASGIDQFMAKIADFHDSVHPDHEPLGATPEESAAADEPPPEEDGDEVKKSARLKLKAAPHIRLEKRLKLFRAKAAKSKVIVKKQIGKSEASAIAKAAALLAKIETATTVDETLQAASGFHAKALAGLAKGCVADDGIDTKAMKAQVEKATAEANEYRKIAEKATRVAEEADARAKRIAALWKEHREKNWKQFG